MSFSTMFVLMISNMLGIASFDCPSEGAWGRYHEMCEQVSANAQRSEHESRRQPKVDDDEDSEPDVLEVPFERKPISRISNGF